MQLHTRPGDICYELFSGSGSQLIAGEKTGRKVYGLELSEAFYDVVLRRWQEFTDKTATLDGDGRASMKSPRSACRSGDGAKDAAAA